LFAAAEENPLYHVEDRLKYSEGLKIMNDILKISKCDLGIGRSEHIHFLVDSGANDNFAAIRLPALEPAPAPAPALAPALVPA
jgi:hypothetical protein